jgi:hypothetical protein
VPVALTTAAAISLAAPFATALEKPFITEKPLSIVLDINDIELTANGLLNIHGELHQLIDDLAGNEEESEKVKVAGRGRGPRTPRPIPGWGTR